MLMIYKIIVLSDQSIHFGLCCYFYIFVITFLKILDFLSHFSLLLNGKNLHLYLLNPLVFIEDRSNIPNFNVGSDWSLLFFCLIIKNLVHRLNLIPILLI